MKSKNYIVPRTLVEFHFPHPEYYGESMVKLHNGMITDVYTDDEGYLYTITNDVELIDYLSKYPIVDPKICISCDTTILKSASIDDVDLLQYWLNTKSIYSVNDFEYERFQVIEFISHSITINSNLLIIFKAQMKIGFIGYSYHKNEVYINFQIYERFLLDKAEIDSIIKNLVKFILESFQLNRIVSTCLRLDEFTKNILERNNFKKSIESYIVSELREIDNLEQLYVLTLE